MHSTIELLFPLPRQPLQQGIGLRLPQFQVLEEVHQQAHLVERQPDDVHLIGDGQHDFRPELATAEDAGDLAVLILRAAIDFIGHQHRLAVLQPPYRPRVRQPAVFFLHARRKDFLGPHGLGDLLRGASSARPATAFRFRRFFPRASCRCSSARTENGCETFLRRRAAQLPLPVLRSAASPGRVPDSRSLQLSLQRHDHIDQPIERDPPREDIFLELLNVHAPFIINSREITQRQFQEIDSYSERSRASTARWSLTESLL